MMKSRRWLIVLVVYLASVVVILNQYKVPPLMSGLMAEFGVGAAEAGWFMSVFALMGIVLALPAALLLRRFGPKASGAAQDSAVSCWAVSWAGRRNPARCCWPEGSSRVRA